MGSAVFNLIQEEVAMSKLTVLTEPRSGDGPLENLAGQNNARRGSHHHARRGSPTPPNDRRVSPTPPIARPKVSPTPADGPTDRPPQELDGQDAVPVLRDEALGRELARLEAEEQAERDAKAELARLRDVARFD
jgi:hypothetical protein